jgi:hypothetical protein
MAARGDQMESLLGCGEFGSPTRSTITRNAPEAEAFVSFGF